MASKRSLKRAIHLICEDLFAEALAVSLYGAKAHHGNAEAFLFSILKMEDEFLRRICHPEPGIPAKTYYKKLKEDFSAHASDIIDQLNG